MQKHYYLRDPRINTSIKTSFTTFLYVFQEQSYHASISQDSAASGKASTAPGACVPVEKLERAAAEMSTVSGLNDHWGLVHTREKPSLGVCSCQWELLGILSILQLLIPFLCLVLQDYPQEQCSASSRHTAYPSLPWHLQWTLVSFSAFSQVSTPQAVTATFTSRSLPTAYPSVTIAWFFSLNPHIQHSIHQHVLLFLSPHPLTHIYWVVPFSLPAGSQPKPSPLWGLW